MRELKTILALHQARARAGAPSVLATVVRARGSTYRRPGARMLMSEDTWLAGGVSGGCLEADVVRKAWWRTEQGAAVVITYDATTDDEDDLESLERGGFGLGCNGAIDVLLERLTPGAEHDPLTFLAEAMRARHAAVLVTVLGVRGVSPRVKVGERLLLDEGARLRSTLESEGLARAFNTLATRALAAGASSYVSVPCDGAELEVSVEYVPSPQALLICGGGFDVVPVSLLAAQVGWEVTVAECRASAASVRTFDGASRVVRCRPEALGEIVALDARTAAVVMSHHYQVDRAALGELLPRGLAYVGVLGPRRRTERLLGDLARAGHAFTAAQLAVLHAPVGLDLGAEGPDEIALSIVSEIKKALARRTGLSLTAVRGPAAFPQPALAGEPEDEHVLATS